MANRPPIMAPHNETEHSVTRITREGKQLTYKLSVMQQPERARACGAGAKSSADRRPVDPPPVVELRIFESDPANDAQKTDITFAYNANFFLYATLDTARPMAHGRVGGPQSCPVLTGVPVAGVAYLDGPSQAGYFIFPDLSVRHEGRYRLSFHLYEEIKDPKDTDKDSALPLPNQIPLSAAAKPGTPHAFLHFRLEVKSVPFTVYSAKKFPGLATSTSLSRIIAEQGCRVRIRRDVRMRRRGDKRDEDYEFGEERAAAYARSSDRFATPDRYAASIDRPRSNSNGSNIESPYGFVPPDRRPSAPDYGFQCPQPYQRPMPPAPPMTHSQTPSYQSHLSFGSTPSHYPAPHMPPTPPPVVSQGIYSPQNAYAQIRHPSNASEYEGTPIAYPAPQIPSERGAYSMSGMNSYGMEPPKATSYMDPRMAEPALYQYMSHIPVSRPQTPTLVQATPSLKPLPNEYANHIVPSVESTSPGGSGGGYDNVRGKRMVYQTGPTYGKRSHEDTFGLDERSMQNGMRPDTEPYPGYRDFSGESRAALMAEMGIELAYKRANGKMLQSARDSKMEMEIDIDPSPAHQRSSRKHLRSSDDDDSDWSSDISGQFDDAEEAQADADGHRSPAAKLSKRRRSNDWPLPEEAADYGSHERRTQRGENGSLNVSANGAGYKVSPRASPRGSLASLRARHAAASASSPRRPRGRTSRFIEATMSDSVSEKPPSIYLQENKQAGIQHRSSGIFRFGKAIASAFNPFGGWGRNSEGSPNKSPQKDVISQAEKAYAELKKAGYQGTNKGHYTEDLGVNTALADQTWRSIQHKMEYSSPVKDPYHHPIEENRGAPSRSESSASKRSSLQDLRLTKSFFKSPSASPAVYCDRTSDEYEPTGLRKQPSRRELSRQTKLLKKVSNLEEKLQRARRELRELTGNEERAPVPTAQANIPNAEMDPALFPRKFVPGALPSLPSERLLDQQAAENKASGSEAANLTALSSIEDRENFSFEEPRSPQSPAKAQSPKWRSKGTQPASMVGALLSPCHEQHQKPTTPIRMKKSQPSLRPVSSPAAVSDDDSRSTIWSTPLPAPPSDSHREAFYHHPQRQLNPDRSPHTPTRSKTSPSRRRSGYPRDDDIPPVPPLPEELRSSAAKVKVKVNKPAKKRPVSAPVFSTSPSTVGSMISGLEDYQWPDDIF
ncbi:hypothetical protein CBS147354_2603 [Penicillium roqueforti]|nr:hypothetical protein CBS147354_2603 [Penicillium roqueforti]